MNLPSKETTILALIFVGGGIYGLTIPPSISGHHPVVWAITIGLFLLTGLLLLLRFRWSPEMFGVLLLFVGAWGIYTLATKGYTIRRLIGVIGPLVPVIIFYPSIRKEMRGEMNTVAGRRAPSSDEGAEPEDIADPSQEQPMAESHQPVQRRFHERLDLDRWVKDFPLSRIEKDADVSSTITGPLPVAYVEQIRAEVMKDGGNLGRAVPVDVCVWKLGDCERRTVTKIGGIPYWPADEEWPTNSEGRPYTFVAQFCFGDSKDILPKLPGDILAVLARKSDYMNIELRWFKIGNTALLPAEKVPAPGWAITPCHAVLHRTVEYPEAGYTLFEKYPGLLKGWASRLDDGSKIGGTWVCRGELEDPEDIEDAKYRKEIEDAWVGIRKLEMTFFCQLGSIEVTERQPFLNVGRSSDLAGVDEDFLMISDVGGYDFFYDGRKTDYEWFSG